MSVALVPRVREIRSDKCAFCVPFSVYLFDILALHFIARARARNSDISIVEFLLFELNSERLGIM
jgi:hypothetical protein